MRKSVRNNILPFGSNESLIKLTYLLIDLFCKYILVYMRHFLILGLGKARMFSWPAGVGVTGNNGDLSLQEQPTTPPMQQRNAMEMYYRSVHSTFACFRKHSTTVADSL